MIKSSQNSNMSTNNNTIEHSTTKYRDVCTITSAIDKRKMITGSAKIFDKMSGGRHGRPYWVKNVSGIRIWTGKDHGTIYFPVGDVDVCLMRNGMFQLSGSFEDLAEIAMRAHRKLYFVRTRGIWRCRLPKNYSFVLAA